MPSVTHTVEIAAPVETVFEFDADPENWSRTMPSLRDLDVVERTDDGTRMRTTYELLGFPVDGEMELTVVEPNAHIAVAFESPGMTGEVHNRYSETDSGTKLDLEATYEFGDSLRERVIAPIATRYNRRQSENHLQTTKELVEAETRTEATIER